MGWRESITTGNNPKRFEYFLARHDNAERQHCDDNINGYIYRYVYDNDSTTYIHAV